MSNALQDATAGQPTYAITLNQLIELLSGTADVGPLSLFPGIANPAAPTLAAGASGNPNGTYHGIIVNVTGLQVGGGGLAIAGFAPSPEATITVTDAAIVWTLVAGPPGTIGRIGFRTVAGGASGTEQFAFWVPDNTTLTWTDNVPDASLGTGMPGPSSSPPVLGTAIPAAVPGVNSTGTTFQGVGGGGPNSVGYWLD